jgi:Cd2+/Zn2+-exporting ATPase
MLSGDNIEIASLISKEIGISEYKANLLPQNKVNELEEIINNKNKKDEVCYIGDGINDAPVLMRADVGISMGLKGSDAAIEASDIVLMKDDLRGILLLKKISKKTMKIVYQNIIFSIAIKFIILALSAFGITNMWFAVFGDVGVAFIAILNAMRAMKVKEQ